MPFRRSFDCLWCGRHHETRDRSDVEGWAQLCSDCVGRAGENAFLRFRLHAALGERAADRGAAESATAAGPATAAGSATGAGPATAAGSATGAGPAAGTGSAARAGSAPDGAARNRIDPLPDDWYLRRGPFARGPLHDQAWQADLEAASAWLAAAPLTGRIVELGAGTGWWSPVLARKGELWAFDEDVTALDAARERLLAHGLRAHLHVRNPGAAPDAPAGAVFVAFRLGRTAPDRVGALLALVRRWLAPGGTFAFVEAAEDPLAPPAVATGGVDAVGREEPAASGRPPGDAREPRALATEPLAAALSAAGFERVEIVRTGRFLLLGTAHAAGPGAGEAGGRGERGGTADG